MEARIADFANTYRGLQLAVNEKQKPKNMQGITEMKVLTYSNILTYEEDMTLSNTINEQTLKEASKVYINTDKKYKDINIKQKDIVLPINASTFEPHFINWNSQQKFDNVVFHSKLILLRVNEKVAPEFLFFILRTRKIRDYFRKVAWEQNRETYRLTCQLVDNVKINVPDDIKEQMKIVEQIRQKDLEVAKIQENIEKFIKL